MDDSMAYADLILPDHHALETESIVFPPVAGTRVAFTATTPVVRPLYNTRAMAQALSDVAQKMNIKYELGSVKPELAKDETWEAVLAQGGLWRPEVSEPSGAITLHGKPTWSDASFAGAADEYPMYFQPYPSIQYHDGGGANLPWLQELPDPVSSSMWGLPVELDPQTAATLKVNTGDWVRVESPVGSLQAQAYVHPAALPGVVSMAIGGGHINSGRYGSGRGVNPLSIVSPQWEQTTNSLAFGGTRVRVSRLERSGELIQFSPNDREQGPWGYR
jgi:anaerobic selenocysteine-containing dehydrogenase